VFAFQVATAVVTKEESNNQGRRTGYHGSILGHNIVNRNRKEGELRLYNDYFAENPKFTESQFQRRFSMSRRLFLRIANAVEAHNPYFKQRTDVFDVLSLSCLQKVTAAHRILFFLIRGNPTSRKAHFLGPGERVKPRLSQALTRGARPNSNSRLAVQISSPLPSRHAPWGPHRILAYGIPADLTDEYLRIGETTMIESLRAFVKAIV
jgi:hypothetical protein